MCDIPGGSIFCVEGAGCGHTEKSSPLRGSWHRAAMPESCLLYTSQDGLEEARLSKTGAQFGSTKRGIAYAYGDKYMKKTLRMGDLLHLDDAVKKRLVTMVDSKNLVMEGSYNAAPISVDEMWAWLEKYAAIFKDYICDVGQYLACLLYTS